LSLFARTGLSPVGMRFILSWSVLKTLVFPQEVIDFRPELVVFLLQGHDATVRIFEIVMKSGDFIFVSPEAF
jgi:hypothetical protein